MVIRDRDRHGINSGKGQGLGQADTFMERVRGMNIHGIDNGQIHRKGYELGGRKRQ